MSRQHIIIYRYMTSLINRDDYYGVVGSPKQSIYAFGTWLVFIFKLNLICI